MDIRDGIKPSILKSPYRQSAIAEAIGLNDQQLSDIIGKRRKLDANEMLEFCKFIGITPNELQEIAKAHSN